MTNPNDHPGRGYQPASSGVRVGPMAQFQLPLASVPSLLRTPISFRSGTFSALVPAATAWRRRFGVHSFSAVFPTATLRRRRYHRSKPLSGGPTRSRPWRSRDTPTARPSRARSSREAGKSTNRDPSVTTKYGAPSGPAFTWPRKPSGTLSRNRCPVRAAIPSPTALLSSSFSFASLCGSSIAVPRPRRTRVPA